jgi:two-component system, NtrC family, sensor kinase
MKSCLSILIIFSLAGYTGVGQTAMPPAYEIVSDTGYEQNIDTGFYQMLADKKGNWTINEVSTSPLADKFYSRAELLNSGDTLSNTFWFRYHLINTMKCEARLSLNANSEYDDFYLSEPNGKWKCFKSGLYYDWDKKDGLKYLNCIPIVLQPGESFIIYQRIHNRASGLDPDFTITLLGTETAIQQDYVNYVDGRTNYFDMLQLQEAFVVGLLFLALFINLFFFRIVREKVYLNFAFFVIFLCISRMYNIANLFLGWEHPEQLIYVLYIRYAWAFIPYFLIQFFRQFFQTKNRYRIWDKWLIAVAILNVVLFLLQFISKIYFKNPIGFLNITTSIVAFSVIPASILITLLLFIRSRDKSMRFVIFGAFPLMLFYLYTSRSEVAMACNITLSFSPFYESIISNFRLIEIICVSWFVLTFSWILFMRYDRLMKENAQHAFDKERLAKEKEIERNEFIEKQKTDLEKLVAERTADLKQSLEDLKATQSQLIQSEKMASLGELTAGVAHEIQNPLNFVNNFSEVNTELIDELLEERKKEIRDITNEDNLLNDIRENEKKIIHHGKRADAIVKGMLQHSRSGSSSKEPTDINALADEYLRLVYHGLRARDKSFNATMKTDFDQSIGNISIIPQDFGRAILNLVTNAFYAVTEKKQEQPDVFEPLVSVSTRKTGDKILISVADNGNGIPQNVLEKIFQPFFTTKPSGQGTGLGLSLSYDIVKAHGGELLVETKEGEGTTFSIHIPA